FTGSAGISIISQSGESCLFVDGRYTIQASEEAPEFKIIDITQNSLIEWINNKINGNIGLCPELHTMKEILLISDPLIICWILNIRSSDMQYTPIVFGYLILTKENEAHIF
uniref:Creatinase N-terminal domain-containing protein n=1 Tax=Biomphalaria glabrata TaxID=6526 RepID=A0A2C9L0B7_BIOGL